MVRIIAPSGPVNPDYLQRGVDLLRSWGLEVELGDHVLDRQDGFLAASDAARLADLQRAWCDPRVAAVICARGGYGLQRILDDIDWTQLAQARSGQDAPVLVGCSDVTALHEAVATQLEMVSLHGPMAASRRFLEDEEGQRHLRGVLFGEDSSVGPVTGRQSRTIVGGRATGVIVGGCLSMLVSGLGTRTGRAGLAGGLLVLEDVVEQPYRIDRMLTQLLRAGVLDGVAGVAAGTWIGCGSPEEVDAVLADRLGGLGIPIVCGLDVGHGRPNLAVPLGVQGVLDADRAMLWWQSPALR